MAENAGVIYAEMRLKIDEFEKKIVAMQKKVGDFGNNISKQGTKAGSNFGWGLKSGFDLAGRGAVMFGKILASTFGPVMILISAVMTAISAIKNAFGKAAEGTAGFATGVAALSSFINDKLITALKPLAAIIGGLTNAIVDFLTKTSVMQRESAKVINEQNALLATQGEALKKIAEEEQRGLITAQEAAAARAAAYAKANDEMIGGVDKIKKANADIIASEKEKEAAAHDAAEQARITGTGFEDIEAMKAAASKEAADNIEAANKNMAEATKQYTETLEANIRKQKEEEALAEALAKKKAEREAKEKAEKELRIDLEKQWMAKIKAGNKLLDERAINENASLSDTEKKIKLLELEEKAELERLENLRKEHEGNQLIIQDIDTLIGATKYFYEAQKKGLAETPKAATDFNTQMQKAVGRAQAISGNVISIMDTMAEVNRKKLEEEIALIDEMLEKQKAAIEEQRQRELEEAGFAEVARAEDMDAQIEAAKASGDQILQYQLQRKQQEKRINEKYDAQTKAAEEKAAKDKAKLEYEMAMEEWKLNIIKAINNMASAIAVSLAAGGGTPLGFAMAALAGAAGAVQVAALQGNPPKPPKFETGGIVPGSSYSGDKVPALVNSGELILNRAQQGAIAGQLGSGAIQLTVIAQLDGVEITRVVAETAGSGIVTIPLRGIG
jgi:hypothetical protein